MRRDLQKESFSFNHPEFHKRESTLMRSRNANPEDFEYVISSMKNGSVNAKTYIKHQLGFEDIKEQFEMLLKPESGVIKAMISV
jgi:threonine dehydrogenase-like Zn-dependent dehydrogenase